MPREGLEPTPPRGERILSPPRLPFRHLGGEMEAASGFEPLNRGFADPRLNHLATPPLPPNQKMERKTRFELATPSLARRCSTAELLPLFNYYNKQFLHLKWCRGGDLNSYGLSPTTPSRWRVYQFHHLGTCLITPSFLWHLRQHFVSMAGVAGLEPAACGFGDRCSTKLSYTPIHNLLLCHTFRKYPWGDSNARHAV